MTPFGRIQKICLIVFVICFVLPFTAAVLPAELAPAVMLTGMLGGGVSLLAMVGIAILARVKRKAPAFEVRTVWVEWRYGPEEWEEFVGREWQGKKQGAGWAVALCAGGGGLAALTSGQWSAVPGIAGIGLGIGLLLGGGILAGGAAKRQQRRRQAAEVAIGPYHVRLQQEITNWRASGIRLKKVSVEEGGPARLVFHLRRPRAKADERLEVPVPSGRRAEAGELAKRFAADGAA